jgi:hypothetical protein
MIGYGQYREACLVIDVYDFFRQVTTVTLNGVYVEVGPISPKRRPLDTFVGILQPCFRRHIAGITCARRRQDERTYAD